MLHIGTYPRTRGGRPAAWYAADWTSRKAFVFDTKAEAAAKGRELDRDVLGHIVNVDWAAEGSYPRDAIGHSFQIIDGRAKPHTKLGSKQ